MLSHYKHTCSYLHNKAFTLCRRCFLPHPMSVHSALLFGLSSSNRKFVHIILIWLPYCEEINEYSDFSGQVCKCDVYVWNGAKNNS